MDVAPCSEGHLGIRLGGGGCLGTRLVLIRSAGLVKEVLVIGVGLQSLLVLHAPLPPIFEHLCCIYESSWKTSKNCA